MPTLPDELFSLIERLILAAREAAEVAAEAAINTLAVNRPVPYPSMNEDSRQLRRALRAKARQLGGGSQTEGLQPLVEEIAYQQWHRMLFARFLAENNLLMHPTGVSVSLQDCAELAPEEGDADAWAVAARYASEMLPGIFRRDDPVVQVRFAPEGRQELERILGEMPKIVFQVDDSLGWMYQFWQSKKKEEVNKSGRLIGGVDLAPVTQLFTENYMVRFLLENSLGAWWAARHPDSPFIQEWEYLRFKDNGEPAAGNFPGWPQTAVEVTVMDPCCGSGHFLVAAFEMLRQMRMDEEGLDATEAGDAVIQDNIHGLELDLRSTQIAVFSMVLIAWKTGGYRELPSPNIACSGIPVQGNLESWQRLAGNDVRLKQALTQLYKLFENAPTFGSLIDPARIGESNPLFVASFEEAQHVLELALVRESSKFEDSTDIFNLSALDTLKATRLLEKKYWLIITNVPFLSRRKQSDILRNFIDNVFSTTKSDLATVFLRRCQEISCHNGTYAIVTPENWKYLGSYKLFRKQLLNNQTLEIIVNLGPKAFRTPMWDLNICLSIITNSIPPADNIFGGIELAEFNSYLEKSSRITEITLLENTQSNQKSNPDHRIILNNLKSGELLGEYANSYIGFQNGDTPRFIFQFWEVFELGYIWELFQLTTSSTSLYDGRTGIIRWENGKGDIVNIGLVKGTAAWGRKGILVRLMGNLPATLYSGNMYDQSSAALIPHNDDHLLAIWAFCSSQEYHDLVRNIDRTIKVTNATLVKVPFDLKHWQKVADAKYPNGLPEPYSNDPTQWLFKGHLGDSTEPLQVAVARLLSYRWPEQEKDSLDKFADEDGIVPLIPAGREEPAADRLRAMLAAAYGEEWSPEKQRLLLAGVDFSGKTLEDWLRDGFFKQHVKLFKNRPFIWHIWDGRKDGFHALVNYHMLDAGALDKLIYTYLGGWIEIQRGHRNHGEPGADGRLVAALKLKEKLETIREGEPPYDIYVRWKSLAEQSIGWNPDLNDGVRLNIRPFVTAGVLRRKFTIHWKKDRGKNPDGSERHNDLHYTNEEKRAAR